MRQAIVTKYYGPTNRNGSRIKATAVSGSVWTQYRQELTIEENHFHAAMRLAHKFNWYGPRFDGNWVAGGMPDCSGNVYTYDDENARYTIYAP